MKGVTITTSRESVAPATPEQWAAAEAAGYAGTAAPQIKATPKRGRLIVIEGIDGSGKSTLAAKLHLVLSQNLQLQRVKTLPYGPPVLTREPYDPKPPGHAIGRIRAALQADSKVDPYQLAIMFAADRFAHLEDVVLPALQQGRDVVCDRYTLSTLAYQTLKLPEEFVFQLVQAAPKPDITVLLDMEPDVSMQRLQARGLPLEVYESKAETQIEIRDRYLDYVSRPEYHGGSPVIIVAAARVASTTPDELAAHVAQRIADVIHEPTVPTLEYRATRAQYMRTWIQDTDRLRANRMNEREIYKLSDLIVRDIPEGNFPNKRRYLHLVHIDGFNTDNPTARIETREPPKAEPEKPRTTMCEFCYSPIGECMPYCES